MRSAFHLLLSSMHPRNWVQMADGSAELVDFSVDNAGTDIIAYLGTHKL